MLAGLSYHVGRNDLRAAGAGAVPRVPDARGHQREPDALRVSLLYVAGYFLTASTALVGMAPTTSPLRGDGMFTGASLVLAGHWLSRSAFISASPVWMFRAPASRWAASTPAPQHVGRADLRRHRHAGDLRRAGVAQPCHARRRDPGPAGLHWWTTRSGTSQGTSAGRCCSSCSGSWCCCRVCFARLSGRMKESSLQKA